MKELSTVKTKLKKNINENLQLNFPNQYCFGGLNTIVNDIFKIQKYFME